MAPIMTYQSASDYNCSPLYPKCFPYTLVFGIFLLQIPLKHDNVAVFFTADEWEFYTENKNLYSDVLISTPATPRSQRFQRKCTALQGRVEVLHPNISLVKILHHVLQFSCSADLFGDCI